jgi:type VI secretion system protein VasG
LNIPRKSLFGKLNLSMFRAIESATSFARLRGNPYVELVHWLHQIHQVSGNDMQRIYAHYGIESAQIEKDTLVALNQLPNGAAGLNDFSHHIELAVERAWVMASLVMGEPKIRGAWLLAALLQTPELRRLALGISPSLQKIPATQVVDEFPLIVQGSNEAADPAHDASDLTSSVPGESSGALPAEHSDKNALAKYSMDLTAQAKAGKIDPVIGREHEIRTMVDILLRRRQNNPLLTGEAGVGKTAVVEGLAVAIAQQTVPPSLHKVRLLSLDVGALLAGASMRGEFESRLKAVLKEASESPEPVILFIDEVHTLVGAGGQAGTGDAANLLKPALARGTLRTIGATTWSEYKKHIEKDPALTRRFQVLQILEPQEASAMAMVRGLVPTFAKHHQVIILDEAISAAVELSHRYIPARQLPDKAISLLDTACARVAMSLHAPPAAMEQAQQQLSNLQLQAGMLLREQTIGKNNSPQQAKITSQITALELELASQTAQWEAEKALSSQILALREQLLDPVDAPDHAENTVNTDSTTTPSARPDPEALIALEQRLHALQTDPARRMHLQVDASVVANIVADWTGIPVGRMLRDEVQAVVTLQAQLEERVRGQSDAIGQIAQRIKTAKAKLSAPEKPLGTFLLVGPSGVGKTETALALAQTIYGGEHNLITINMSEYQESHTVSSLKGSPPGYVGYGEGGVLTEAVRRRPYSVILLDEIEKAHPDVHEVFYQVFDKGWMEDGEGRVIDFKNTLILLTSNTGSDLLSQLCEDPALLPSTEALVEALQPELRKVFPAAFLGRLSTIPYLPLQTDVLQTIVELQLNKVVARMQQQHAIGLHYTPQAVAHIVQRCGTQDIGARRISQFIEQHILPTLADLWLQAMQDQTTLSAIHIDRNSGDAANASPPAMQNAELTFRTTFQPATERTSPTSP